MKIIILSIFTSLSFQCTQPQTDVSSSNLLKKDNKDVLEFSDSTLLEVPLNIVKDRTKILKRLASKIANKQPLIVHAFIPLCDNENQGIVPTTESLGNGMSLRSNLYWATSKGMKRYFKERSDWKILSSSFDIDSNVLERIIFKKVFKNTTTVYLIADAYRGDRMNNCLADFFNSLSGNRIDSVTIEKQQLEIGTNADLLIFNGHNGLMDDTPIIKKPKIHFPKDAVAIACVSGLYFSPFYEETNSFPLVNTNHLLYPGAFITEAIINKWAELGSAQECKIAAGKSYYKHKPKSGPNGSQNLFNFGY